MFHTRMLYAPVLFMLLGCLLLSSKVEAVAFKMKNDSQYTLRARVYDRGAWRPWVVFSPDGWGDFATNVKRAEHTVEIQIWDGYQWQPLYWNNHGSKICTRVVQAFNDNDGNIYFAWWDEQPFTGCRQAPPDPWSGGSTCLKPSGWIYGEIKKLMRQAVRVGTAYVLGK